MSVRIALAENNQRTRHRIIQTLQRDPSLNLVIEAENGEDLLEQMRTQEVDLVLMDIEMPAQDGISATSAIAELYPSCRVIMLTTFDDDDKIFQSILAGASGYLLKDETGSELVGLIHQTLNGGAAMSASIALKALTYIRSVESSKHSPNISTNTPILTPREIELLELLRDGFAYKQIAASLQISEGTVRKHLENVYRKLKVNNKVSAINAATRNRLIR
jgi:DNA-binding NarL/FixJ family response regulator